MLNLLLQYLWIYSSSLPPNPTHTLKKSISAKVVGKMGKFRTLKEGVHILLGNNLIKLVHFRFPTFPGPPAMSFPTQITMFFPLCSLHRQSTLFVFQGPFYLWSMTHSLALISSLYFTWFYHPKEITNEFKTGPMSFHLQKLTLFLDGLTKVQGCAWAHIGGDPINADSMKDHEVLIGPQSSSENAGEFLGVL